METNEFLTWMSANIPLFVVLILGLSIWSAVWKGVALWMAARKGALAWFIVLMIFNTAGILEILYIFVFSKMVRPQKMAVKTPAESKK